MTFADFCIRNPPLGREIILQNGCYSVTRHWFRGEIPGLVEFGRSRVIDDGWQGKETTVDVTSLKPLRTMEVLAAQSETAD